MPQMSPMDWMILKVYFLMLFTILLLFIYFMVETKFMNNYQLNLKKDYKYKMFW